MKLGRNREVARLGSRQDEAQRELRPPCRPITSRDEEARYANLADSRNRFHNYFWPRGIVNHGGTEDTEDTEKGGERLGAAMVQVP
jgi:hypothetical protein